MNMKNIIYLLIGFVIPVVLIILGILLEIKNVWLYTGSLTWLSFVLLLFISYKS
ncbi:MAG: hypothetical protein H5T45_03335 [Thermoplasmatales archaeon]|nr:hypothetical protein [Thermoplasmatales archaeon]